MYVCCKLSIIYTCICRYWPKLPCQQSQNVLSIFLWICSSGYGVQVNVDLYDTSNEDLFPSQSSPYYLVLTCTFRSPVRAVTSGLSPSGLWHQGSLWLVCYARDWWFFLLNCFFPVAFRRRKYRWAWPQGSLLSLLCKKYLWIKYSSILLTFNKGKEMCITMHVTK